MDPFTRRAAMSGTSLHPSMQSSARTTCSAAMRWAACRVRGGRSTSSRRSAAEPAGDQPPGRRVTGPSRTGPSPGNRPLTIAHPSVVLTLTSRTTRIEISGHIRYQGHADGLM